MIKQLIPRAGRMKICLIENTRGKSISVNDYNKSSEREKIFKSRLYFLESLEMVLLQFNDREFELYFRSNEEGEVEENSTFLSPKLKQQEDDHFILSGLFKEGDKSWIAVGKFEGNIPNNYSYHEDDLKYQEGYWERCN
jgi:hypothetical protein